MGSHGVTRCPAQGTWEECACLRGCRSLRGWSVAQPGHRAPSSLLLSLGCLSAGMLAGWECSQQGFFPVRATDSSWSLGTAPPWAGATGETGWGVRQRWDSPNCSALGAQTWFPSSLGDARGAQQGDSQAPGEAVGGLGDQRPHLSKPRTWLVLSSKPSLPQLVHASGRGAALNSILRWGCICSDPGSLASRDHQPWHDVALPSLSPVSLLHVSGAP